MYWVFLLLLIVFVSFVWLLMVYDSNVTCSAEDTRIADIERQIQALDDWAKAMGSIARDHGFDAVRSVAKVKYSHKD